MFIELKSIKVQNFLSYGKNLENNSFEFKNGLDLVTATNGSGKSAIFLDSINYALFGKPFSGCACRSLVVEPHSQFKGLAESYVHGKVDVTSVYARRSDKNTLLFIHLYELIHVHAVVVVRNTGDGVVAVLVGDRREGMIYTASVLRGKVGRQNKV